MHSYRAQKTPRLIINSSSFHETILSCTVKKPSSVTIVVRRYTKRDAKRITHEPYGLDGWKGITFTQQIGTLAIARLFWKIPASRR